MLKNQNKSTKLQKTVALIFSCFLVTTSIAAPVKKPIREPEAATGFANNKAVVGSKFMVSAANPYASKAGYNILKKGGSAIDAAIAVEMVLNLVEPQSSGIGGGSFILHWDQKNKYLTTFDGRETAPAQADERLFLQKNGQPVRWIDAVVGGRSVGVPGLLAALKLAHEKYGKLPWQSLFEEAITLAEQGFVVSPRLEKLVALQINPGVTKLTNIKHYFYPNNRPIKAGDVLKNPKLAKVLRSIAQEGIKPFYQGWIAKRIVNAVQKAEIAPGLLSLNDLKNYRAIERKPVCAPYRQYSLCGMAPPSSGGVAVIQILKQLERFNLANIEPNSLSAVHLFTQSSRLAFADRNRYLADADFVEVPVQDLINETYLAQRSQLINQHMDMGKAIAGTPLHYISRADDQAIEMPSTSHVSIIDAQGNAISMTSSIEMGFGSAVMVEGFILNNQLTDFSLVPEVNGKLVANRLEPNKRPRSSMAPTIVFNQDGSLKLVVGSPGGSRIINYVAQTIIGVLDWQLDPQAAINLAHVTNRNKVTTLEKGRDITGLQSELVKKGHNVVVAPLNSGIHAIAVNAEGKLIGGADPRREGKVLAN